ncbi:MAG: M1 family metallopeptidase [Crocinitomicaceae bacterium]
MRHFFGISILIVLGLTACTEVAEEQTEQAAVESNVDSIQYEDKHSLANTNEVHATHIHVDLTVDFNNRVLSGVATHDIEMLAETDEMVFDIHDLDIEKVTLNDGDETSFELGEYDELLGQSLSVKINAETKKVNIHYATRENSKALLWLNPQQTADKEHPYVFTQGEAVLTRTWIPCQDTPGNRITYSADIQVPSELMAVMSADNPTEKNAEGKYHFEMPQPIPTYLIALAAGDLTFASLGERTGVYAEPSLIDKCTYEFAEVEDMISAAEELYGPYKWGRYDIIVLPPSFPYGGMENPRLTFATPTILAGDRSLVSLIAHELAHSWSGNLVTNATWDDFWLNEGFTVYFESRIMEALYGKEHSDMLFSIEYDELMHETNEMLEGEHPEDTHLKLDLEGRDPDEGMTSIAYVKGALFLKTLEDAVGREAFDIFIKTYFADHEFETLTTEGFVGYLNDNLLEKEGVTFNTDEWIYGEGIPDNAIEIKSDRFEKVEAKAVLVADMESVESLAIPEDDWSTQEWMHFIRQIPAETKPDQYQRLDEAFGFSSCGNAEVMSEWYVSSIRHGYEGIYVDLEEFLMNVGRRKFLRPIYTALAEIPEKKEWARKIYAAARPNYHSISYNTIDKILDWEE